MQADNLALTVFLFLVGMVLTIKGGDFFVDAASWIAERSGIPKLIIGATIVSLATTLPEMLVSVMAAAQGKVDMSIGNAIGSVTANLGLIMGIALVAIVAIIAVVGLQVGNVFGVLHPLYQSIVVAIITIPTSTHGGTQVLAVVIVKRSHGTIKVVVH